MKKIEGEESEDYIIVDLKSSSKQGAKAGYAQ